ncbi:MAG: aminopeptidase N, partial [Phototrophicales bacterium]
MQGLYKTGEIEMTQFESNGFTRMTPYPSYRTDILPRFTVRGEVPAKDPVILSNGNLVGSGTTKDGRHWALYENPVPVPAYIVAFAAGDLGVIDDEYFTTRSGRKVHIPFYAEEKSMVESGRITIDAIKKSLRFDETDFDAEFDPEIDNFKALA